MIENLAVILTVAFLVERVVEIVRDSFPILKSEKLNDLNFAKVLAFAISFGILATMQIDLISMILGVEMGIMGILISALFVSGGSNVIHDVIKQFK